MPSDVPAPPAPRRILLDATGWTLIREGGGSAGLAVASLPDTGEVLADRPATHRRLVATDVLHEDGRPTRTVHAALAVLTTAPVTVTVERRQPDVHVAGLWRTLGAPTAGLVLRSGGGHGDAASTADRDVREATHGSDLHRGVELQLLAIDDLVDTVVDELLGGAATPTDGAGPADAAGHVDVEVAADDPAGWPDGVVVDGEVVARADVVVDGPAGTSTAHLWGDGRRWWQVGASAPDRLRGIAVTRDTVHATVVAALAGQFGSATAGGSSVGGADRG